MFTNNKILSTDLSTSIPQRRSIFAIFVHFGDISVTNTAITSIIGGTLRPDHIIIVDHTGLQRPAKPDGEVGLWDDTKVSVISEPNTGYAAGLASGLILAGRLGAKKQDICLLLNNDISFAKESLGNIAHWWDLNGGQKMIAGAAKGYVSLLSGRAHIMHTEKKIHWWNIPYVHGSCMVGEFGLFSSIFFPTSFFMYWEDVAISINIRKQLGVLAVIPGLGAVHNDNEHVISSAKLFYMVRNGAYVLERFTPPWWRLYWYIMNTIRMMYHFSIQNPRHASIFRGLVDARASKLGKAGI